MAINKRGKNRLRVHGKEYLWWVFDETDQTEFDGVQVKIVSADGSHFLKYGLEQEDGSRKVALVLKDYAKAIRLKSPKFESEEGIVTRSGIKRLLEWVMNDQQHVLHARDGKRDAQSEAEKLAILKELQAIMMRDAIPPTESGTSNKPKK